jgi:hypothetical protein
MLLQFLLLVVSVALRKSTRLQAAAPLTSGPKIVAFHKYRLSSEIGLAEHLERWAAAAATPAAAWVETLRGSSWGSQLLQQLRQHVDMHIFVFLGGFTVCSPLWRLLLDGLEVAQQSKRAGGHRHLR